MDPRGYDVFILAGQSNMVGRGRGYDMVLDAPHPEIWQWGRTGDEDGTIIPAVARLAHNDSNLLDRVGMGLSFAKTHYESQESPRPILLVPTARGGTGYSDEMWNPGDPLFEDAVSRANAAMASEPGNRLVGILWHQGERDVGGGYSTEQYAAAFDAMLLQFRVRVPGAGDAAVVLGEFAPAWAPANSTAAVLTAIRETPDRIPYAAIAPSSGLTSNPGSDTVHFDAVGQRAYGPRYAEALLVAQSRIPTLARPSAPLTLTAEPSSSSLALTWSPPSAGAPILGYRIMWREGGGAWSGQYSATAAVVLFGLAPSTDFEVEVFAQNRAGLGPPAGLATATAAPGTPPTPARWYTFEERDATNSGRRGAAADAVLSSGVSFVDDPARGRVAQFVRPTGAITVPGRLNTRGYTISAWVRFDADGSANIVSSRNGGVTSGQHFFFRTGGSPSVVRGAHTSSSPDVADPDVLALGTWAHYALTYNADDGRMVLYRNGVQVAAQMSARSFTMTTLNELYIGAVDADGRSGLEGRMDDVRIYERPLEESEIADIAAP